MQLYLLPVAESKTPSSDMGRRSSTPWIAKLQPLPRPGAWRIEQPLVTKQVQHETEVIRQVHLDSLAQNLCSLVVC